MIPEKLGSPLYDRFSMKLFSFIFLYALLLTSATYAQDNHAPLPPIPVESMFGNNRVQFIGVLNRPVTADGRLGYFNLSTGMVDYSNTATETELVIVNNLTYSLFKNIRATAGAEWHYKLGLVPQIGLQYFKANRTWLFLLNPSFNFQPSRSLSTIGIMEFKPAISKAISFYSRTQVLYVHNLSEGDHARSALMLRAGLSFSKFTIGLGTNFDYYGPKKMGKDNFGLFTRLNL
jgi:hypothetical protein